MGIGWVYLKHSTWPGVTVSFHLHSDWKFLVTCFSGALKSGSKSHLKQLHVNSQLSSSSKSWRICFGSNVLTYARVTSSPASKWHEACGKEHITNMKSLQHLQYGNAWSKMGEAKNHKNWLPLPACGTWECRTLIHPKNFEAALLLGGGAPHLPYLQSICY